MPLETTADIDLLDPRPVRAADEDEDLEDDDIDGDEDLDEDLLDDEDSEDEETI